MDEEKKRIHLSGGKNYVYNADIIISINKNNNNDVENSKIKIIRNKFTPSK